MKQRLTYLVRDPSNFNPDQIRVTQNSISVEKLDAAREQHLTLGLGELPDEIQAALKQCHELHLRWASPTAYAGVAPYTSRVSPGLHAFFTPRRGVSADLLCPLLKRIFGEELKCDSVEETFVQQPILSERFSTSSLLSYHQVLTSEQWVHIYDYLVNDVCGPHEEYCERNIGEVRSAQYVDLDYDAISHAVVIKAYWNHAFSRSGNLWLDETRWTPSTPSIEVGVLNNETPDPEEPEEIKLGGFLTLLGQDTSPKATLFSFPARHHALPAGTYQTSFQQPTGLHPKLQISLTPDASKPPREEETCALHAYLTLPSYLFIDKYQFDDPLFLAEHNLASLRSIAGATDLEAPDWVIPQWGSSALFELAHRRTDDIRSAVGTTSTIPLHLRYLPPSNTTDGLTEVPVPWPVVFWACKAEEGLKMGSSPFDRVNLGYDGLFGPRTMFYHVAPQEGAHMIETLRVPVLKLQHARFIEIGTIAAIVVGTAWVCWKLLRVVSSDWSLRESRRVTGKKVQ